MKFIPGILLLQAITIVLVLLAGRDLQNWGWLKLAIPVLSAGFLTAFWFSSIAAQQRKGQISRLKESYAKERETIRVDAERAKIKAVKQAQRKTLQELRRASRRANVKIGLAFAGAAGLAGLLMLAQLTWLGFLTLSTAVGAVGGYSLRMRQEKGKLKPPNGGRDTTTIINATPNEIKQLPRVEPPPAKDDK